VPETELGTFLVPAGAVPLAVLIIANEVTGHNPVVAQLHALHKS